MGWGGHGVWRGAPEEAGRGVGWQAGRAGMLHGVPCCKRPPPPPGFSDARARALPQPTPPATVSSSDGCHMGQCRVGESLTVFEHADHGGGDCLAIRVGNALGLARLDVRDRRVCGSQVDSYHHLANEPRRRYDDEASATCGGPTSLPMLSPGAYIVISTASR